jgi:pullulanase
VGKLDYKKHIASERVFGASCSKEMTTFRVFSPTRTDIRLRIYEDHSSLRKTEYAMNRDHDGSFSITMEEDLKGKFYTYIVDGRLEVTDPYSVALSCNSKRSAIIDLSDTDPEGWKEHRLPAPIEPVDSVLYEVHIKDFTAHESLGSKHPGTFRAFAERGRTLNGRSLGIDHLVDLGVTHVHLMPVNDFLTVREEPQLRLRDDNYNWGYDPEHYNAVEGSYSTDPYDPRVRIRELKALIMALHKAGLRVVIDVVYNHTYRAKDSNFHILAPGHWHRMRQDGTFSDGAGCGNELATEKPLVREFIVESLEYWVNEFKIDGFRFDLMALIDIDTMELAVDRLRRIRPDILIYGEPWTGGITTLPSNKTTSRGTQSRKGFAIFNDSFRNAIKGDNDGRHNGFAQGNLDERRGVETGIAGSIFYDEGRIGFASRARETINYANSHDNLILQDKLLKTLPGKTRDEYIKYNKLIHGILFLSQGIPFIHAGNEFLRTKGGHHNTYNAPLSINAIDWTLKEKNLDFYSYLKDLIAFRKLRPEFRIDDGDEIRDRLHFLENTGNCHMLSYTIKSNGGCILVIHNANQNECLLPHAVMRRHIEAKRKRNIEEIKIRCLFDENGIVRENGEFNHPHGISVPGITTYVYELKIE